MKFKNLLILVLVICTFSVVSHAGGGASVGTGTTDQDIFDDQLDSIENAGEEASDQYNWMSATFDTISSFLAFCIEVPQFPGITQSSVSIDLEENPRWISTGVRVEKDKMLQIDWSGSGIQPQPKKYKVLYRIDPRFSVPQVFIQEYSYDQDKYLSDFHSYRDGILLDYQDTPEMDFTNRITDFDDYFHFRGRSKIFVNDQDVVNITLDYQQNFFSNAEFSNELGGLSELSLIYTESPLPDNRVIYSNASHFCTYGITDSTSEYVNNCAEPDLYKDSTDNWNAIQGRVLNPAFNINKTSLNKCADGANGKTNDPLCYYDQGRGMNIGIGGNTIKGTSEKFKYSPFTSKEFFYYRAPIAGYLDFSTFWDIDGMYNGYDQFMVDWPTDGDYFDFKSAINTAAANMSMNHLYFGRYLMEIEIGNSESIVTREDLGNIEVEYIVSENGSPNDSENGTVIDNYYRGNAPETGYLFFKVRRLDDNLDGSINIRFANYIGTSFVSDLLYTLIVLPLRDRFNEYTQLIYTSLAQNDDLVNALRLMLVIYISIYALMFLAGAVEITVSDIVGRVIRIGIVVVLFTPTSWDFFNGYVFRVFTEGLDFLMSSVAGVTSSVGNPFGFIDPIFDKYTNPTIYALLLIQMLQIHTGLILFSIIAIYALYLYLKAILQIIIAYCIAFVGLSVMISLAPIFISFILFERTRSIFDNWLSVMFNYVIEPTILLIFFLLIDQIMSDQLLKTVARACWGTLIPLNISLDLNNVGIPLDFSFSLPFLPGIPFYIPEIVSISTIEDLFSKNGTFAMIASSTFLLFALSKLAGGMVHYVQLIAQQLTNVYVEPEPGQRSAGSLSESIMSDIKAIGGKTIGAAGRWGKGLVKGKVSDQSISRRRLGAATIDTYGSGAKTGMPGKGGGGRSGMGEGGSAGAGGGVDPGPGPLPPIPSAGAGRPGPLPPTPGAGPGKPGPLPPIPSAGPGKLGPLPPIPGAGPGVSDNKGVSDISSKDGKNTQEIGGVQSKIGGVTAEDVVFKRSHSMNDLTSAATSRTRIDQDQPISEQQREIDRKNNAQVNIDQNSASRAVDSSSRIKSTDSVSDLGKRDSKNEFGLGEGFSSSDSGQNKVEGGFKSSGKFASSRNISPDMRGDVFSGGGKKKARSEVNMDPKFADVKDVGMTSQDKSKVGGVGEKSSPEAKTTKLASSGDMGSKFTKSKVARSQSDLSGAPKAGEANILKGQKAQKTDDVFAKTDDQLKREKEQKTDDVFAQSDTKQQKDVFAKTSDEKRAAEKLAKEKARGEQSLRSDASKVDRGDSIARSSYEQPASKPDASIFDEPDSSKESKNDKSSEIKQKTFSQKDIKSGDDLEKRARETDKALMSDKQSPLEKKANLERKKSSDIDDINDKDNIFHAKEKGSEKKSDSLSSSERFKEKQEIKKEEQDKAEPELNFDKQEQVKPKAVKKVSRTEVKRQVEDDKKDDKKE